jgi:hypothetical protein
MGKYWAVVTWTVYWGQCNMFGDRTYLPTSAMGVDRGIFCDTLEL